MPAYQTTPFKPTPKVLVVGRPSYLWGSYNDRVPPTALIVTAVAAASNVATVYVKVKEGNIPVVSGFAAPTITIVGTTSNSGDFNVTEKTISSVSIDTVTGVGTIAFALTTSDLSKTADGGQAISEQPEVPEALANGASIAVAAPMASSAGANGRTLTAQVSFPSIPTTCTGVTLQGSNVDRDSEYQDIGTAIASVATGTVTGGNAVFQNQAYRFYRFKIAGVAGGTSPSILATLEL